MEFCSSLHENLTQKFKKQRRSTNYMRNIIRDFIIFGVTFGSRLSLAQIYPTLSPHVDSVSSTTAQTKTHQEHMYKKNTCTSEVTPEDDKNISEFMAQAKALRESLTGAGLNVQLRSLVDKYNKLISDAGKRALAAIYAREQLSRSLDLIEKNNSVKASMAKLLEDQKKLTELRQEYRNGNSLVMTFLRQSKLQTLDNAFGDSAEDLIEKINQSDFDPIYKRALILDVRKLVIAEAKLSGEAGDFKANHAEWSKPIFMAGLPVAVAGGALAGSYLTAAGVTAASATAKAEAVKTPLAVASGMMHSALYGTAAGTLGGYTYGQVRGVAGLAISANERAKVLNDEFMCAFVDESKKYGSDIQKSSLEFAAMGAAIGGVFSGAGSLGGIYSTVTRGIGALATGAGTAVSSADWYNKREEAETLFKQAQNEAKLGHEEKARELLNQSIEAAKDSRLAGLDASLAAVGAYKTGKSFFEALKNPPKGLLDKFRQPHSGIEYYRTQLNAKGPKVTADDVGEFIIKQKESLLQTQSIDASDVKINIENAQRLVFVHLRKGGKLTQQFITDRLNPLLSEVRPRSLMPAAKTMDDLNIQGQGVSADDVGIFITELTISPPQGMAYHNVSTNPNIGKAQAVTIKRLREGGKLDEKFIESEINPILFEKSAKTYIPVTQRDRVTQLNNNLNDKVLETFIYELAQKPPRGLSYDSRSADVRGEAERLIRKHLTSGGKLDLEFIERQIYPILFYVP